MMARGARHFAFISRSGIDKPEAAQLVNSLIKEGASVSVYRADAANEEEVLKAITQESSNRPIRGVVHAAMVLNVSSSTPIMSFILLTEDSRTHFLRE